jgi:hypothetical protein
MDPFKVAHVTGNNASANDDDLLGSFTRYT